MKCKRFLAIIITLAMVLCLMPAMAFADSSEDFDYYVNVTYDENIAIFPGDKVTVEATEEWSRDGSKLPASAEFSWSLSNDTVNKAACSIKQDPDDPKKAVVKLGKDSWFVEAVVTVKNGGKVISEGSAFLFPKDPFYKLVVEDFDYNIKAGEKMTIHPELMVATKDSGNDKFTKVKDAKIKVFTYDENDKRVKGTDDVSITKNSDGSFTIKRITDEDIIFSIRAYLPGEKDYVENLDLWLEQTR